MLIGTVSIPYLLHLDWYPDCLMGFQTPHLNIFLAISHDIVATLPLTAADCSANYIKLNANAVIMVTVVMIASEATVTKHHITLGTARSAASIILKC